MFRRFENLAGIQADWDVNPYIHLTGGYDHFNIWTLDDTFSEADHSIDTVYVRPVREGLADGDGGPRMSPPATSRIPKGCLMTASACSSGPTSTGR